MSASLSSPPPSQLSFGLVMPPLGSVLVKAVDSVPEIRGMGIVLIANSTTRTLRATPAGGDTVIFEFRPSPVVTTVAAKRRTSTMSPAQERLSFGFNCGGAALA